MQIAVVVPDEIVDDLDQLVPSRFRSRAEVVRHALDFWLAHERSAAIDRAYRAAYDQSPQSVDEVDAARVDRAGSPSGWEDLEW